MDIVRQGMFLYRSYQCSKFCHYALSDFKACEIKMISFIVF